MATKALKAKEPATKSARPTFSEVGARLANQEAEAAEIYQQLIRNQGAADVVRPGRLPCLGGWRI